jgi:hypothetical protein
VRVSDVAAPDYRDTVVIGTETWRMQTKISGNGFSWELALERAEAPVWR